MSEEYVVKEGDTLNSIAEQLTKDVNDLYESNKEMLDENAGEVKPGDILKTGIIKAKISTRRALTVEEPKRKPPNMEIGQP